MITCIQTQLIQQALMRVLRSKTLGERTVMCHNQGLQMDITITFPESQNSHAIAADMRSKATDFFHFVKLVAVTPKEGKTVATLFCSGIKNFSTAQAA